MSEYKSLTSLIKRHFISFMCLSIMVMGCSAESTSTITIKQDGIENRELIDKFYTNVTEGNKDSLKIKNQLGIEGQTVVYEYSFDGNKITVRVISPHIGDYTTCIKMEKGEVGNTSKYLLRECRTENKNVKDIQIIEL